MTRPYGGRPPPLGEGVPGEARRGGRPPTAADLFEEPHGGGVVTVKGIEPGDPEGRVDEEGLHHRSPYVTLSRVRASVRPIRQTSLLGSNRGASDIAEESSSEASSSSSGLRNAASARASTASPCERRRPRRFARMAVAETSFRFWRGRIRTVVASMAHML